MCAGGSQTGAVPYSCLPYSRALASLWLSCAHSLMLASTAHMDLCEGLSLAHTRESTRERVVRRLSFPSICGALLRVWLRLAHAAVRAQVARRGQTCMASVARSGGVALTRREPANAVTAMAILQQLPPSARRSMGWVGAGGRQRRRLARRRTAVKGRSSRSHHHHEQCSHHHHEQTRSYGRRRRASTVEATQGVPATHRALGRAARMASGARARSCAMPPSTALMAG